MKAVTSENIQIEIEFSFEKPIYLGRLYKISLTTNRGGPTKKMMQLEDKFIIFDIVIEIWNNMIIVISMQMKKIL